MKPRIGSKAFWIAIALLLAFAVFWGSISLLRFKQLRDKAAVHAYIDRIQPLLLADPRFKDVRLMGYSCDSFFSPYMPIFGTVSSKADWDAHNYLIQTSKPPVFATAEVVKIGRDHN